MEHIPAYMLLVYIEVYSMSEYVYEFKVIGMDSELSTVVRRMYDAGHVHVYVIPGTTEKGDNVWVVCAGGVLTGEYDYLGDFYDSLEEYGEPRCLQCTVDGIDPRNVILSW